MMKNPNPKMLVRIAQGDAYGVACEYIKFPRDQATYDQAMKFESYGKHPTHKLVPGQYTDDTQMSLAVAETLLWKEDPTPPDFAEMFFRCFKRDWRDGYSRGFQAILEKVSSAEEMTSVLNPDSDKNGAAMRSVPIGVLPSPYHVLSIASMQAKITHNTEGGVNSSVLIAMLSHFALYHDEPFIDFPKWVKKYGVSAPIPIWDGKPVTGPNVGMNTAHAVYTLVSREKSLMDIARRTIEWGGDTDSVLSLAWGIASTRMQDEKLPEFFDSGLENGTYGRTFLEGFGTRLMERFQ